MTVSPTLLRTRRYTAAVASTVVPRTGTAGLLCGSQTLQLGQSRIGMPLDKQGNKCPYRAVRESRDLTLNDGGSAGAVRSTRRLALARRSGEMPVAGDELEQALLRDDVTTPGGELWQCSDIECVA